VQAPSAGLSRRIVSKAKETARNLVPHLKLATGRKALVFVYAPDRIDDVTYSIRIVISRNGREFEHVEQVNRDNYETPINEIMTRIVRWAESIMETI